MKQLAVFGLIMLLVVLPSCKFLREKGLLGRKVDTMVVWQAKLRNMRVADSIRKVQDGLLALENAKLDSVNKADQERGAWESKYRYNIILGSFVTPEYARNLSADLSKKGYKTRIIKLEGTVFEMVSAEAHDNFRNAVSRLHQFQDTVSIDAWLYIIKKK
jgi:hypothetical protein